MLHSSTVRFIKNHYKMCPVMSSFSTNIDHVEIVFFFNYKKVSPNCIDSVFGMTIDKLLLLKNGFFFVIGLVCSSSSYVKAFLFFLLIFVYQRAFNPFVLFVLLSKWHGNSTSLSRVVRMTLMLKRKSCEERPFFPF